MGAFARICQVSEVSELITGQGADAEAVKALADAGLTVKFV